MLLSTIEEKASQIEAALKHCHVFVNKSLAVEAVQMSAPQIAAIQDGHFCPIQNNKRLAVLGDAVLAKVLCTAWYDSRNTHGNPHTLSHWTTLRTGLLANESLAERGFALGFDQCVITDGGNPRVTSKMMATTIEAVIGAIYKDGGDGAVQAAMEALGFFDHILFTSDPFRLSS